MTTYKGYKIQALGTFPMFTIHQPGQGGVPSELQGTFTSPMEAERAIERSFAKLMNKGKKKNDTKESAPTR